MLAAVLASPADESAREKSDLQLKCGGGVTFHAHRSILRFFSEFFFEMLRPGAAPLSFFALFVFCFFLTVTWFSFFPPVCLSLFFLSSCREGVLAGRKGRSGPAGGLGG